MIALRGERITPFLFFHFPFMTTNNIPKNGEKSKLSQAEKRAPERDALEFHPTTPDAIRAPAILAGTFF